MPGDGLSFCEKLNMRNIADITNVAYITSQIYLECNTETAFTSARKPNIMNIANKENIP